MKPICFPQKKIITLFLLIFIISSSNYGQPKEEVRAVWLTTVWGLDWPKSVMGEGPQKSALIRHLDKLAEANINTIYFQVRARGDLIYASEFEPWSAGLTGNLGNSPGYDPLQFAIEEAHKRGMELHAWWVVYKVYGTTLPPLTTPKHVLHKHLNLCKVYRTEGYYMDPGFPETNKYLVGVAMEMVNKYNIDAIHFDYIRYPGADFNDDDSYAQYGNGMRRDNWRRENINSFVAEIYDSIQAVKPWIKVGSAPIGIYVDIPGANGWSSYDELFQDSKAWVDRKIHDYLAPQTYWQFAGVPYYIRTAKWWPENVGTVSDSGRHIYLSSAIYKMSEENWSAQEIMFQIDTSRYYGNDGQSFFRSDFLVRNYKGLSDSLKANQYKYPANIPSMPWKDNIPPNEPLNLSISTVDSLTYKFSWDIPNLPSDGDSVKYYNLYFDMQSPIDIGDVKNILKFKISSGTSCDVTFEEPVGKNLYFTVTAYDYGNNESLRSNEEAVIVSDIQNETIISEYELEQNYPNPFNPSTIIRYKIEKAGDVRLSVFDILGREVVTLKNEYQKPGTYEIEFSISDSDASTLSAGIYFYTIRCNKFIQTKKMIILK